MNNTELKIKGYQILSQYLGLVEMEKFISKKLRLLPELLLIEIYRYGVFSFALNPANKKYYRTGTLVLEQ